ncbi:MAG: hypothetical protein GZ094_01230 [Mariniphaga sp.]|nr:hypothetical protein [Mariniphaga sp.]
MKEVEEIDENTLDYARNFKKKLRFDVGQIVYLRSDKEKKNPMVVYGFDLFSTSQDYWCMWISKKRQQETMGYLDKILNPENHE